MVQFHPICLTILTCILMATNNNLNEHIRKSYKEYLRYYAESSVRRANDGCSLGTTREHETPEVFPSGCASQHSIYQRMEPIHPLAPHLQAPGDDHVTNHSSFIPALSLAPPLQQPQGCTINALNRQPELHLGQIRGGYIEELSKRKTRTIFTESQKSQMKEFADKLGWTTCGNDEDEISQFCSGIGITRKNLRNSINNNRSKFKN